MELIIYNEYPSNGSKRRKKEKRAHAKRSMSIIQLNIRGSMQWYINSARQISTTSNWEREREFQKFFVEQKFLCVNRFHFFPISIYLAMKRFLPEINNRPFFKHISQTYFVSMSCCRCSINSFWNIKCYTYSSRRFVSLHHLHIILRKLLQSILIVYYFCENKSVGACVRVCECNMHV